MPPRDRQRSRKRLQSRHYGLPDQTFPFRPREPREQFPDDPAFLRQEIDDVLVGIDDMIWKLVRKRQRSLGISEEDAEDLVQNVRLALWERGLPNFSTAYKVKLSTYLYSCVCNYIRQGVRDISRRDRHRKETLVDPDLLIDAVTALDQTWDRHVEAIAEDVFANPEKYLTKDQAFVFRALMEHPDMLIKDLAGMLDYSQASSLSMMTRRIKDRLALISVPDGPR